MWLWWQGSVLGIVSAMTDMESVEISRAGGMRMGDQGRKGFLLAKLRGGQR